MSSPTPPPDALPYAEKLESELGLKQLQINRLLNITQAINGNVPAGGLFDMYTSFLNWEMGVRLMALYFRRGGTWSCAASIGLSEQERALDLSEHFADFTRLSNLEGHAAHPLIGRFSVVIPVQHKEEALAYVFLGDVGGGDAMYNKVQFVTTITNVIAVAIENKRLFQQQLDQQRYEAEMELASEIQRSLIPEELPRTEDYEMAALYRPRYGVGGDFYSAVQYDDGKLLFCVADIAGKGTGAALLMSNFEASFYALARVRPGMRELVYDLNKLLFRVTRGERFVTLFIGEYDSRSKELVYVNAGHNPPILARPPGEDRRAAVSELRTGCVFLGMFEHIPAVELGYCNLGRGGLLVSYTDGVSELASPSGELYGEERLAVLAERYAAGTAKELNMALLLELEAFRQTADLSDDVTVLTTRFW